MDQLIMMLSVQENLSLVILAAVVAILLFGSRAIGHASFKPRQNAPSATHNDD